ncbi:MAG: DUF1624 domain-containing protein [Spirochaetes bacterium]|nr:DUF1624 domain-containing protein [Spirochaetota bacterium]MBU0957040.1 DUF1624 domain-containing protein [Spirochaetota bacterium]
MKRLQGLDIARALAVLGMMFVNYFVVFNQNDSVNGGWLRFFSLFEGRAAAIFLVLAGIGLGLMSHYKEQPLDQTQQKKLRATIIKRSGFLFVLGMILYVLGWNADILHYYAIYMLIALIFLHAKTRNIISAILAVLGVTLALQLALDYTAGWDFNTYSYTDFYAWRGFVRNLFFNGFHPVFPWISFMLVGIVVVRIDLSDKAKLYRLLVSSLAIALCAELASALLLGLFNNSETA